MCSSVFEPTSVLVQSLCCTEVGWCAPGQGWYPGVDQEEFGSGHFREVAFVGSQLKSSDREMMGLLPAFEHGGRGCLSSTSPRSYSIPAGQRK